MTEFISKYIKEIDRLYQTGLTTEHSFRPALLRLLQECTKLTVVNEQTHIACGAPDLTLFTQNNLAVAYVEAKDLQDNDLDGKKKNKSQFDRYKNALSTIVFTDYLDFHLYEDGELLDSVAIASIQDGHIILNNSQTERFLSLMEKLRSAHPQKITSPAKLAKLMAGKARLMADAVRKSLDNDTNKSGSLWHQLKAFKDVLNKDLDETRFADLYAQTIAYGLFAARIHDTTPLTFTRQEAANLIPHSNPFLRQIFQQLAGYDINNSIAWIVDDLVNIFAATDVKKLRKNFGKEMQRRDPMIHFYEDFLKFYDPAAKKKYGVYYTPQPVVEFIVRAVDDILKTDFALPKGLADTSKVDVTVKEMEEGSDTVVSKVVSKHRVQVLDPATGTGTFLAEVVGRIKEQQQKGAWPAYVDEHLIPRIYGFEYMMAPYTIAHLKLDMLINWWDDEALAATHNNRLQIYLTNSLDQTELTNKHLLAEMIAREANEANNIKHNAPVMVMLGNPPYSVSSSNKSPWILNLLEDYKKNLNERNIQPLSDDYIKFIRLGQYYIERTGEGVLAYISNNSFLDGIIHRQMRRELMRVFDKIYILDLHGNTRKKETAPDGSKDENVFSIMQGVSINIFVKKKVLTDLNVSTDPKAPTIHHYDLFGSRKEKYAFLLEHSLSNVEWQTLTPQEPNLFFVPKDFGAIEEYKQGFKIEELMKINGSGIKFRKDNLLIHYGEKETATMLQDIQSLSATELMQKYHFKETDDWKVDEKKQFFKLDYDNIKKVNYRPFDTRYSYYPLDRIGQIIVRGDSRLKLMYHILCGYPCSTQTLSKEGENISLIVCKQQSTFDFQHVFCSSLITDMCSISAQTKEAGYVFPLYLYPTESELGFDTERKPNLDETIWRTIENWVQYGQAFKPLTSNERNGELGFDAEPEQPHSLAPEDIFDYIYGVLHSPAYRAKYKEFLKVDFPRIPYPKDDAAFDHFRSFGYRLRELHLMHNVPESTVEFPEAGSMMVDYVKWNADWNTDDGYSGRVYINDTQYFDCVPTTAWDMYIGGYQPAQKWLKDRKGRTLSYDDITHYRRIIAILIETARLMREIDS